MKNKKRDISSFNLAFLDIMFCGFGAVVLLVLIINSQIVSDNKIKTQDLTAEVDRIERATEAAKIYHLAMQTKLQENADESSQINDAIKQLKSKQAEIIKKNNQDNKKNQAIRKKILALQNEIKAMNKSNITQKKINDISQAKTGNKVRQYEGEGHRQYLTGLKLGGKRILFLLDSSASMLDETIVNIIVKRNMPNHIKRASRKWQQAIKSVQWMVANLPVNSRFAIISFNDKTNDLNSSLKNEKPYQWLKSTDKEKLNRVFAQLKKIVPQRGTNLRKAFASANKFSRKPDNIILITDGLPTQGATKTNKSKIDSASRIKLFRNAIKIINNKIPVNTILLAMEGDPMAAALFWKLAIDTRGSFITPSRDWP
ncbi:vWA domain-containing protein [sulfur-oxidizing endosymbiont of Gigantopelta aegis]|uniref:vWA domain-containing protein n=1 Tax=sulfur-oxidizing endosymbiont of Gigantopelta aegis TaxID=2794934 RepID=UPI0018DDDB99|nr:vWA domain-containing protein [sulfur-oxidizing endosymbiont of Gigantopelta aegis]